MAVRVKIFDADRATSEVSASDCRSAACITVDLSASRVRLDEADGVYRGESRTTCTGTR
jgi:hypothetical protein